MTQLPSSSWKADMYYVRPEEMAVKLVINKALEGQTVKREVLRQPTGRRSFTELGDVVAPDFSTTPIRDGLQYQSAEEAEHFRQVILQSLTDSHVLQKDGLVIQADDKHKLSLTPNYEKVDIDAALKYLSDHRTRGDFSTEVLQGAIEAKKQRGDSMAIAGGGGK